MQSALRMLSCVILVFSTMNCQRNKVLSTAESKKIDAADQTVFVPTLETSLDQKKNTVYCSTLLLAWDEFKQKYAGAYTIKPTDSVLYKFDKSESYKNSIPKTEYTSSIVDRGNQLSIRTKYHLQLPYVAPFDKSDEPLQFLGTTVSSFGSNARLSNSKVKLLHYENDNEFIIQIYTKDITQELILMKTDRIFHSLGQAVSRANDLIQSTQKAMQLNPEMNLDFQIADLLFIPKMDFNLFMNFSDLENKDIRMQPEDFTTKELLQMIAFKMDENGIEVKSEVIIMMDMNIIGDFPTPKKLIFDKPFLMFIRKKGAAFPAFAMRVSNAAFMLKK